MQVPTHAISALLEPAATHLIVLGASKFDDVTEDSHREEFAKAKDAIVAYFRDDVRGLALPADNIHEDLFDSGDSADAILSAIGRIVQNGKPQDLFVYAASHGLAKEIVADTMGEGGSEPLNTTSANGKRPVERFCLMLLDSVRGMPDTYLDFDSVIQRINAHASDGSRVYYVVDACYSGLLHTSDMLLVDTDNAARGQTGPFLTFLTSNNSTHIGDVPAGTFTTTLHEILMNGVEAWNAESPQATAPGPFLCFQDICEVLKDKLGQTGGTTSVPQCSGSLSGFKSIQNNVAVYNSYTEPIRKMRVRLTTASHADAEAHEWKRKADDREVEISELRGQLRECQGAARGHGEQLAVNQATIESLRGQLFTLEGKEKEWRNAEIKLHREARGAEERMAAHQETARDTETKLNAAVATRDGRITTLQEWLNDSKRREEQLRETAITSDKTLAKNTEQIEWLKQQLAEAQRQQKQSDEANAELRSQVTSLQQKVQERENLIFDKDAECASLQQEGKRLAEENRQLEDGKRSTDGKLRRFQKRHRVVVLVLVLALVLVIGAVAWHFWPLLGVLPLRGTAPALPL